MTAHLARPGAADTDRVRASAPLAADRLIRCGPFAVPAGILASVPTLEQEDSDDAAVLRQFLADDPWAGMGSVHPGGWLLIGRDDEHVVFAQRQHDLGLTRVVTLARRNGGWDAKSMGGWGLILDGPGERAEYLYEASVRDDELTLGWDCGADLAGRPLRMLERIEVLEGERDVHLLVVSVPNPAIRMTPAGGGEAWVTVGVGRTTTDTVTLSRPLGDRRLISDSSVPAHDVTPSGPSSPPVVVVIRAGISTTTGAEGSDQLAEISSRSSGASECRPR